ncbi:type II secretion system protein GspG [Brevibacillus laterosporus]|uniref:type II secretion system protein GspG n=1 Tax=Brevibacillus laterosporus TaxID=1465 RepID=UPI0035A662FA
MTELIHSQRTLLQATYTTIKPTKAAQPGPSIVGRGAEKWAFIAALSPIPTELATIRNLLQEMPDRDIDLDKAIDRIELALTDYGTNNSLNGAKLLYDTDSAALRRFADQLILLRKENIHKALHYLYSMADLHPSFDRHEAPTPSIASMMTLATDTGNHNDAVTTLRNALAPFPLRADEMTPRDFSVLGPAYIGNLIIITDGFEERMKVEPAGYLHLERLTMTPASIERGELLYSVPLAPDEEVHISHKEWAHTSEEFERIVTDFVEEYSEKGVTEKSELAQSVTSQDQHTQGFNTAVTASYGLINKVTASASYSLQDSASQSAQHSVKQSNDITSKASARVKKEHKVSFKVTNATGNENETVRKIKNPLADKAARLDYYQLMRMWKVDLYQYGVRLTYDLTVPDPGSDILARTRRIANIHSEMEDEFTFPLTPDQIDVNRYMEQAAPYNAHVEPPPHESDWKEKSINQSFGDDAAKQERAWELSIDTGDDYEVEEASFMFSIRKHQDDYDNRKAFSLYNDTHPSEDPSGIWHYTVPLDKWIGRTGPVSLEFITNQLKAFFVVLRVKIKLKAEALRQWKFKTWGAILEAARQQHEDRRYQLTEELKRLQDELGVQDALSLRKIEREEIMKSVLRWLFGPGFFEGFELQEALYNLHGDVTNVGVYNSVRMMGEKIKFLHHAIEWENMLYFLYPYFWSINKQDTDMKKYLDHPDFEHRAFLKAGSTRVVLTIRPGFERAFLSFMEKLDLTDEDLKDLKYLSICREMENYANTFYRGVPTANPVREARPLLTRKQRAAWADIQTLARLLRVYYELHQRYPDRLEALDSLLPFNAGPNNDGVNPPVTSLPLTDPWGHAYAYKYPGDHGEYDLLSYGADGVSDERARHEAANPENADITSWAESSLIGTWYEFTPTSAMDIEFVSNKEMPNA